MYPETVTATDSYTTKVLKSVEGFNKGPIFEQREVPRHGRNEPVELPGHQGILPSRYTHGRLERLQGVERLRRDEGPGGLSSGSGRRAIVEELSNGVVVFTLGGSMYSADPTSTTSPAPTCYWFLPDAFDHAGKVKPSRVISNRQYRTILYWKSTARAAPSLPLTYAPRRTGRLTFGVHAPSAVARPRSPQTVYTSALNSMKMDLKADKVVALRATDTSLFVFGNNSLQVLRWQNSTSALRLPSWRSPPRGCRFCRRRGGGR